MSYKILSYQMPSTVSINSIQTQRLLREQVPTVDSECRVLHLYCIYEGMLGSLYAMCNLVAGNTVYEYMIQRSKHYR